MDAMMRHAEGECQSDESQWQREGRGAMLPGRGRGAGRGVAAYLRRSLEVKSGGQLGQKVMVVTPG